MTAHHLRRHDYRCRCCLRHYDAAARCFTAGAPSATLRAEAPSRSRRPPYLYVRLAESFSITLEATSRTYMLLEIHDDFHFMNIFVRTAQPTLPCRPPKHYAARFRSFRSRRRYYRQPHIVFTLLVYACRAYDIALMPRPRTLARAHNFAFEEYRCLDCIFTKAATIFLFFAHFSLAHLLHIRTPQLSAFLMRRGLRRAMKFPRHACARIFA